MQIHWVRDSIECNHLTVQLYSEKQLKDIKILLTITFGNIIFKQIIFVIDRIITMQFTKMQIEIRGSLVTIQYYTKCTGPLYPKFISRKFSTQFLLKPLPGHCLCSNSNNRKKQTPIYQSFLLIMGQLLQQKYTDMTYPDKFDHKFAIKHNSFKIRCHFLR